MDAQAALDKAKKMFQPVEHSAQPGEKQREVRMPNVSTCFCARACVRACCSGVTCIKLSPFPVFLPLQPCGDF
jgi:hypothetical protein